VTRTTIPDVMRTVVVHAAGGRLEVVERPVPRPGPGEVLVRIAAAPVNPSDLGQIEGRYTGSGEFPLWPGNEGSGTVVATGSGPLARVLAGRRVACAAGTPRHGGTWAEYLLTRASRCLPLRRHVDLEQGATLLVNPLTALALVEIARRGRHRALVNTAAASALGAMISRLARREGLPVIGVVRREGQRDEVLADGARLALVSTEAGFDDRLRVASLEWGATLVLDAVAGDFTGRLLAAAPHGSRVVVYGALSGDAVRADPRALFLGDRRLEGFYLPVWLRSQGLLGLARAGLRAQRLVGDELATPVRERVDLAEAPAAVARYRAGMSGGKVLLVPRA
jgi:NADPH:quinone reductase